METTNLNQDNVKKGVTAIIHDKMDKPYFLIMKRKQGWEGWEFVKGGVNNGESDVDAIKREIIEETGLQRFKIEKKLEHLKKEYNDQNNQSNVHSVFLIEASMNIPVHLQTGEDAEHSTYLWTQAESALSKLTHENDKELLRAVVEELK